MTARPFVAVVAIVALAACAGTRRPAAAPAVVRPLASPAAGADHTVSQVVRGAVGAREMTLNCVVTVQGGAMNVVGLNAMGVRLFTIRYDGMQVVAEKGLPLPKQLTPERLLADLQLVYWPVAGLEGPLRTAGFELSEPAPATRRLRRAGQLIAEVHYAGADPWQGRSWLVNFEHGYSLQIDSKDL